MPVSMWIANIATFVGMPLLMFLVGSFMAKKGRGYNVPGAWASMEAQTYASVTFGTLVVKRAAPLMLLIGIIGIVLTIIMNDEIAAAIILTAGTFAQLIPLAWPIAATQRGLKLYFDKEGKRR